MDLKGFSAERAIKFGWQRTKRHFIFFLITIACISCILIALGAANEVVKKDELLSTVVGLIISVFQLVITIGFIKICLEICNNNDPDFTNFFSKLNLVLNYFAGNILYGAIVLIGMLLLIIPGIIWAIKFQFYGFCIIDKNMGPIEALKKSAQITNGYKFNLFLFGILIAIINLLGVLCMMLGLFLTIPTTVIALTHVYKQLSYQSENMNTAQTV